MSIYERAGLRIGVNNVPGFAVILPGNYCRDSVGWFYEYLAVYLRTWFQFLILNRD